MVDKADELEGEELVAKIGFLVITNSIREGIGAALADLKRFDETPLGQRIRSEYSIASIVDACDDRDIFFKVLTDLASMKDTIDIKYFVAFLTVVLLGVATEKYPGFIADAIMTNMKFRAATADIKYYEILSPEVHQKLKEALATLQRVPEEEVTDGRKFLIPRESTPDEDLSTPALLLEFAQTEIGTDIVRLNRVKSMDSIWESEEKTAHALNYINTFQEGIDVLHFRAFMVTAIEKYPDLVEDYYRRFRFAVISDAETTRIVVELFKGKGHEYVSAGLFMNLAD